MALCAFVTLAGAQSANACTATATVTTALGTYSPPAALAGAIPPLRTDGGLSCVPGLITVLGTNTIKATFSSANALADVPNHALTLKRDGGTETIAYTASAAANGTGAFTQGSTVDYMQNNLLNVLGLLGPSSVAFPFHIKPSSTTLPLEGTYRDVITITWDWSVCEGALVFGLCILGGTSTGTVATTVNVSLQITANKIVVSTSTVTTWDPINGTSNPKSLPGSRRRTTINLSNPDIVEVTSGTLALNFPVQPTQRLALDGDGTLLSSVFASTDGIPASGLTFTYQAPGSTTDDVEFSNNNGATWTFTPIAGDTVSQASVTNIRFRPKGTMASGGTFSISAPFMVK